MEIACPTCHKRIPWDANPWRPFCSERCKLLDLGRWLAEEYRIPAEEDDSESPGGDDSA